MLGVVPVLLLGATATRGAGTAVPNLVGTYQVVTHVPHGLAKGIYHATFQITDLNRRTGKFVGNGVQAVDGASFKITGSVVGRSVRMLVVDSADDYKARDRGTIRANGSISGTVSDNQGSRGRWTMKRQLVVVTKTGWGPDSSGPNSSLYGIGLKLVNRSKRDAVRVTVTVAERGGGLGNLSGYEFKVALIPAGKSFVIGDDHGNVGPTHFTHLGAAVQVGFMIHHSRENRLPAVSDVRLDRKNYAVNAVITNPEPYALNVENGTAYAVLYNSAGRIIGGGNTSLWPGYGPGKLEVGGHESVSIGVDGNMSRAARVQVSASP
ncbi:MAG TPA: hypothetical protein VFU33_13125 [Gaiellaceae bacterium]|nr:hypothetical protein [Gaiellaceae bacterium]